MMKTVNRDSKNPGRVLPVSRFCSLIVVAALLICLCLALGGCQTSGTGEGTVTLVVETGDGLAEYSVRLEDLGEGADAVALLDYLKENYGVKYDSDKYVVNYSYFGANIRPTVIVTPKMED